MAGGAIVYDRKTYKEIKPIYVVDAWEYPEEAAGHYREELYRDSLGYRLYKGGDRYSKYAEIFHGEYQGTGHMRNVSKAEAFRWATEGYGDADAAEKHWNDIMSGKYGGV